MSKTRGFSALVGATITEVNTYAINEVKITLKDGRVFAIQADNMHIGIPVIELVNVTKEENE